MNSRSARLISIALIAAVAGCAPKKTAADTPIRQAERIFSTTGFSILPPQGDGWTEDIGKNQVTYLKQTDPDMVSFYAGALEVPLSSGLADREALVAFVRSKKDDWGEDSRYSDTVSAFHIEEEQETCVRYSLSGKDQVASNLGTRAYLPILATGRFCLHPEDRTVAIDIYYSVGTHLSSIHEPSLQRVMSSLRACSSPGYSAGGAHRPSDTSPTRSGQMATRVNLADTEP